MWSSSAREPPERIEALGQSALEQCAVVGGPEVTGDSGQTHAEPPHQIPLLLRARRVIGGPQLMEAPEIRVHSSGRSISEKIAICLFCHRLQHHHAAPNREEKALTGSKDCRPLPHPSFVDPAHCPADRVGPDRLRAERPSGSARIVVLQRSPVEA